MKTAAVEITTTETLTAIYERRAIRKFKNKPVADLLVEKVIAAGCMAPSAMNRQPWKFYILTEPESVKLFSKEIIQVIVQESLHSGLKGLLKLTAGAIYSFYYGGLKGPNLFYDAPVVIFLTAPRDNPWACYDIGMCAQNMMLAARSLGLDSCPIGIGKYIEHTKVYHVLGIPDKDQVHLALSIGFADEHPSVHKRATDNVVFVDRIAGALR